MAEKCNGSSSTAHEANDNIYTLALPICYICNMGWRDLPDMYAQARGYAAPEGGCVHIRQIPTTHVTYVM